MIDNHQKDYAKDHIPSLRLVPKPDPLDFPWDNELGKPHGEIGGGLAAFVEKNPIQENNITPKISRRASDICQRAAEMVGGDREKTHGPKYENHQNIADHWNAYLGSKLAKKLTALDVALMMAELKIARTKLGAYNPDDFTDLAGYAGVAGEIAATDTWLEK